MLRDRLAALTAALVLVAPGVRAEEPSAPAATTPDPPTESPTFGDRFFRGTSPGELPTEKLALVAGLYVAAAASVGVGVAELVSAGGKHDDAQSFKRAQAPGFCNDLASAECASYRRLLSEERSRRGTALLLFGGGGLLALGGALTAELWHNNAGPRVALRLEGDGLELGVSARF